MFGCNGLLLYIFLKNAKNNRPAPTLAVIFNS